MQVSVQNRVAEKGERKNMGNGGKIPPTQQVMREFLKIHKCYMQVMFLWWYIEDRYQFQNRLELGCKMEAAQNVIWSLRWP